MFWGGWLPILYVLGLAERQFNLDVVLLQLGTKLMLGMWVRRVAGIVAIIVVTLAGLKLDRFLHVAIFHDLNLRQSFSTLFTTSYSCHSKLNHYY